MNYDKIDQIDTSCFTYEISMIVQVLASDKNQADNKLESEGGFVSKRTVLFKDAVPLYVGEISKNNHDLGKD